MSSYEAFADEFIAARNPTVGVAAVRAWARRLPGAARVLDLGCGHGIPLGRELVALGCRVHGVDLSPRLVAAFEARLPTATAEVADAVTYARDPGGFDAVLAWGLLFLLEAPQQEALLRSAARALRPGGRMLATAPWQEARWRDALTGAACLSLGRARYRRLFAGSGLALTHEEEEADGDGGNHYWYLIRPVPESGTS